MNDHDWLNNGPINVSKRILYVPITVNLFLKNVLLFRILKSWSHKVIEWYETLDRVYKYPNEVIFQAKTQPTSEKGPFAEGGEYP